nr:hypothetical protein [Maliibacterium massiliense]
MLRNPVHSKIQRTCWVVLFIAVIAAILLAVLTLRLPAGSTLESMLVYLERAGAMYV